MTRLMREQSGGNRAFAAKGRIETGEKNHLRRKNELYLLIISNCSETARLYPTIISSDRIYTETCFYSTLCALAPLAKKVLIETPETRAKICISFSLIRRAPLSRNFYYFPRPTRHPFISLS